MLGKLMNYEMKAYGRIMLPIYAALLALAAILGVTLKFLPESMTQSLIFVFAMILYVLLLAAVAIVTTILAVNRYYGNLLGREGYFMFSLPTRTSTLMVSKTLSAMIWTAFGTIVGFAAIMMTSVVAFNGADYRYVWEALRQVAEHIKPYTGNVILLIVLLIMGLVTMIVRVYAAVSIGSQWSGHRLIGSILVYIGFKAIETIIASIIRAIGPLREALESLVAGGSGQIANFPGYRAEIVALIIILVEIVVYWVIAWFFTDRKLNLE